MNNDAKAKYSTDNMASSLQPVMTADSIGFLVEQIKDLNERMSVLEKAASSSFSAASDPFSPLSLSSPLSSPTCIKAKNIKLVSRSLLDRLCTPILEHHPEPSRYELHHIVTQLNNHYPETERRVLQSQARRWFRKRREEYGQKCYLWFRKHEIKSLEQAAAELEHIQIATGLNVMEKEAANIFIIEKAKTFVNKIRSESG